jgi:PAS domain S-box-containing protein
MDLSRTAIVTSRVHAPSAPPGLDLLRLAGEHPIVRSFPHGALIVFDHDLRYLAAGGLGLAEVGLSRQTLEGNSIYECFPLEVVEVIEPLYRAALRGEESETDVPYEGRIYLQRLGPVVDQDGSIVAGMGFTQDVTAARQAQQALERSQERLREEHRRLEEAQDLGRVGSWECDLITGVLTWSDAMLNLFGLDPLAFDGDYAAAMQCIHPDDRAAVDAVLLGCRATGSSFDVRYRVIRADNGDLRWFDAKGRVLFEGDVPLRLAGAVADVTEQVQAEQGARTAQAFFKAVLTASPDLTMVIDLTSSRVVYGSRGQGMLGLSIEQLMALSGEDRLARVHDEDRARLRANDVAAGGLRDGEVLTLRYRGRHTDGAWRWISQRITPFLRDSEGKLTQVLGVTRDVTDVVEAEERLTRAALHDSLTGLPNRVLPFDRLNTALARAVRDEREVAVLFCDLDGFKQLNDAFGHATGDAVLVGAAQRISGALREGDTVARIGGDEFVMVVEPWNRTSAATSGDLDGDPDADRALAVRVADRIGAALRRPFVVEGVEHTVTASIGIAYTPGHGSSAGGSATADQLLLDADAAMYRAKSLGKDRAVVFQTMPSEIEVGRCLTP